MKKILISIVVVGILVVFFFPKEFPINSTRKCFGLMRSGFESTDALPTGSSISNPNICFGILYGKENYTERSVYKFVKDYKTRVVVGGVVGITDKTYKTGDLVNGEKTPDGIKVRVAAHSSINEGKPSPNSYQEFIFIPEEYLQLTQMEHLGDVDVYY